MSIDKELSELLACPEGSNHDFKVRSSGLTSEDLVAFANSEEGGTILLGVKEAEDPDGRQRGEPVGCVLTDDVSSFLYNKAANCSPVVSIFVREVPTPNGPVVRVDVPSSPNRPHCTNGGTYKIRDGSSNRSIHPEELLNIFMTKERMRFVEDFKTATIDLERTVKSLKENIENEFKALLGTVEQMQREIGRNLEEIHDTAANAENLSDEAVNLSDQANTTLEEIHQVAETIKESIKGLILTPVPPSTKNEA